MNKSAGVCRVGGGQAMGAVAVGDATVLHAEQVCVCVKREGDVFDSGHGLLK